jgi:hypothetical protein
MIVGRAVHRRIRSRIFTLCHHISDKRHLTSQALRNRIWDYLMSVTGDSVRSLKERVVEIWI